MLYDHERDLFFSLANEDKRLKPVADHLEQLEEFVDYIARGWIELSYEKVWAQRNDYTQKARKLRQQFNVYSEKFNFED